MCGRFTLKTPESAIATLFPDFEVPDVLPRYNIAPTQSVTSVRQDRDSKLELIPLRWGLIPFWSKDTKIGAKLINARSETAAEKPSFRNAFKKRRCLILSDGYFEWKKIGNEKQPYYMTPKDNGPFCMAGLWESWRNPETDQSLETCSILTTDASPSLASIHDRMPVVLSPDDFDFWLDSEFADTVKLKSVCKPKEDSFFAVNTVSKKVNNARNDSPECVQIVEL